MKDFIILNGTFSKRPVFNALPGTDPKRLFNWLLSYY